LDDGREIDEAGYRRLLNEALRKLGPCSARAGRRQVRSAGTPRDGRETRIAQAALGAGNQLLPLERDDRPVHLVLPADRRVDNARLRALLGTRRLRFVTPDDLWALTGCVPGAVPPFGNLFGLEVLVDEELTRCADIAFNASKPAVSITMACADFVRLAGARVAQFPQS
jgi:prolyl-tRNA editing enzyme YbaK/EbsC (Cys-tRNA(Pro) deacylase)